LGAPGTISGLGPEQRAAGERKVKRKTASSNKFQMVARMLRADNGCIEQEVWRGEGEGWEGTIAP